MEALSSFLAMGGYAGYVWSAYGLAAVVMAGVLVASLRAARAREAELAQLQQMRPGRPRRRNAAPAAPGPEKQAPESLVS